MKPTTAREWLGHIETQRPNDWYGNIERVRKIGERLDVTRPACPVIVVGGTNGKGTCATALASIYSAAGYRVGLFTSPALFRHNEQVTVAGCEVDDTSFCQAFSAVEEARGNVQLGPFEFFTLAVLYLFKTAPLNLIVAEIGMGGRRDAVNILDGTASIITSIDLDHCEHLGETRDLIGFEKAGIFRAGRPAIIGDVCPPASVFRQANDINATLFVQGRDFSFKERRSTWDWVSGPVRWERLPRNGLLTQNLSSALMAVASLHDMLPIQREAIVKGLTKTCLAGRIEVFPEKVTTIYDVAHNPAAIAVLAEYLKKNPCKGKTTAVFSMPLGHDISEALRQIRAQIDAWYVAPLQTRLRASRLTLEEAFRQTSIRDVTFAANVAAAFRAANDASQEGDRVVVFGAFRTVAEARS